MYGFHQAQLLSNMAIGIFTLRQQLRGLLSTNWPGAKTPYVEYLVVGGGGGGASEGGGGAGGLLTGLLPVTTGTSYTVTVGGGGAAATSGSNSVLGSVTANGGGSARNNLTGLSGGSGGGGATSSPILGGGGQGIAGQGNSGGGGRNNDGVNAGGGGGGAGTIGLSPQTGNIGGNGGAGIASAISGTVTAYAGGGGGSSSGGTYGSGGVGGGGAAGPANGGTAGTANTGGGGGGTWGTTAAAGGSGIVIVSYPDVYPALASTTGSPTVSTSGSGSISFNGSSYFSYAAATPLALSNGNFTFECWFYKTSSSTGTVFSQSTGGFTVDITPSNGTIDVSSAGIAYIIRASQVVTNNVWNHLAITRSGNLFTVYYNGSSIGTATNTTTFTNNTTRIGADPGGTGQLTGYLTNIRLVKGVVVYTGAFTVPTAPLTATQSAGSSGSNIDAITGTATGLLLNSNSGSFLADSSTNSYASSAVTGTPAWNQLSPFATGLGYKNRVYTWSSTGSGAFTV